MIANRRYRSFRRWVSVAILASLPACSSWCDALLDCSGDYLFQYWTASDDGGSGAPYLDLSKAHYGGGQSFYMGSCSYVIDIEADSSQANGTFSFSDPHPNTSACIAKSGTRTWALSCGQLTVTSGSSSQTFVPQPPMQDE